jgi:predicted nucleic acid-binding protein
LIVDEAESEALRRTSSEWTELASSRLTAVEVNRAVRRVGAALTMNERRLLADKAKVALSSVALFDLDASIAAAASNIDPVALRGLDAIHLATARLFEKDLAALATYDRRLADAARAAGLPVLSPA